MTFASEFRQLARQRAGIYGVTAGNAAKLLGLTNATVVKYLKNRKILARKIGQSWHITLTELINYSKRGN
uniref:Putative DNA binding, helix-turn-helix domain containing protein n=1 Tax=viral metagenome TaxID=1070528 RepID=A0A6M3K3K9_9ZZZZ